MKSIPTNASISARRRVTQSAILLGSLLGLMGMSQPVEASYYYPFYGLGGFTNLLYPLSYSVLPLMGMSGPYSSFTPYTPYRLLSTGRLIGTPYQNGSGMYGYQMNGQNGYQMNGQNRSMYGSQNQNQSTNAQPADAEDNGSTPPVAPPGYALVPLSGQNQPATNAAGYQGFPATNAAGVSNAYLAHQGQFSVPQASFNNAGHALPGADGTPPLAPQVASKAPVALAPNLNDTTAGFNKAARSPLADGFVNLVNTKFQGNVKTALFDPETRSWAKMLGLISDDSMFGMDFNETRVELVRQIFADQGLDSVSKLGAVKILLNGSNSIGTNSTGTKSTKKHPR